jgi:hypothetical protein
MWSTIQLANYSIKMPQYVATIQADGFSGSTVFDHMVMLYFGGTSTRHRKRDQRWSLATVIAVFLLNYLI